VFRIAHHQFRYRLLGIQSLEEHEAELFGNGHLHVVARCQLESGPGGGDAFRNAVHRRENAIQFFAGRQAASQLLITAERAGTGSDKVTDAREAGKRERIGARGNAQASNASASGMSA